VDQRHGGNGISNQLSGRIEADPQSGDPLVEVHGTELAQVVTVCACGESSPLAAYYQSSQVSGLR
jgi:hypothetical protein